MPTLKFQREIGDKVDTFDRNLIIIDREIRLKIAHKNGKPYNVKQKFYKYRCLDCGNEDWSVEYALGEKMHCGCNACCYPPRKVVAGVNDVATTAPWMVKYFLNKEDAQKYTKFSRVKADFICPDCGRKYNKPVANVSAAKTLACVCGDGVSYPNKYMFSLLEQLDIWFEREKSFSWSNAKKYDFYIENGGNKIIIEMNGEQHYSKPIYCITNDTYYRSSGVAEKSLSTPRQTFYSRQIRKSIQREQNYLNHKFVYITRAKFNEATILYPTKTVGNPFR